MVNLWKTLFKCVQQNIDLKDFAIENNYMVKHKNMSCFSAYQFDEWNCLIRKVIWDDLKWFETWYSSIMVNIALEMKWNVYSLIYFVAERHNRTE